MKFPKKAILTSFCILFLTVGLKAQNTSILGAFVSFPVGKFGSTELENGGYAETGWGIMFDSKFLIKNWPENLYIYFHSSYQWNKLDNAALAQDYTDYLGETTEVTSSRYSPIITTIGPKYDIKLGEKVAVGFSPGAGLMLTNTKAMSVKVFDDNGTPLLSEVINFENNPTFTYRFALDFTFKIVPDVLDLSLFADYTAATQKTEFSSAHIAPTSTKQSLQYLNTGLLIILKAKN